MKDESLTDGAPGRRQRSEMQHNGQEQHNDEGDACVHWRDEEAHDQAANQSRQTCVPGKVHKRRPEKELWYTFVHIADSKITYLNTTAVHFQMETLNYNNGPMIHIGVLRVLKLKIIKT